MQRGLQDEVPGRVWSISEAGHQIRTQLLLRRWLQGCTLWRSGCWEPSSPPAFTHAVPDTCGNSRSCRREMDLPNASGDCAGWPGLLPDLRNGARADDADGRSRAEPRARRHVASLLGGSCARTTSSRAGNGPSLIQRRCSCTSEYQCVDPVWPRDTGSPLGRLAVLRAGLCFARQP